MTLLVKRGQGGMLFHEQFAVKIGKETSLFLEEALGHIAASRRPSALQS